MWYSGVHAEARPVPAEHLSGPIPAAAPQEGPHAAQVHRGRNVRAVSNTTLIQITNRIIVWQRTTTLKQPAPRENKKKHVFTGVVHSLALRCFIELCCGFALKPLTLF